MMQVSKVLISKHMANHVHSWECRLATGDFTVWSNNETDQDDYDDGDATPGWPSVVD